MRIFRPHFISFTPFQPELKEYNWGYFRSDALAALATALMTIPQSIAYSLLAGLPPTAGLYSAIFGTLFAAGFGSSRVLVSGPSTGTAILIQMSISDVLYTYYETVSGPAQEALILSIMTQLVLLIGLIQIGAALFNVSKVLQFVSRPVVLGYFGGITVAIAITQLFAFLGVPSPVGDDPILYKAGTLMAHLHQLSWETSLVGLFSLVSLLILRRFMKNWPNALIMIILGSLAAYGFNTWVVGGSVQVLGDFQLPQKPLPAFTFPWALDLKVLNKIFPSAVAISFLGILEVFSIGRAFGAKMGQQVQTNQDVFGLGLGNLVLSTIVGSMPSSGSASRTLLNYRLHAKSRFAAMYSSGITALIVFAFWPLIRHIPLAALAALLIATVHTLVDRKEIKLTFRATREDAFVCLLTFLSCLLFSLDVAFFIGIVISIATYLKKSSTPHLVEYAFNTKGRLKIINAQEEVHRKVRIIGIGGDLYFAAADIFQSSLLAVAEDPNVQAIVLRLNNVYHMDASMCLAILRLYETLHSTGRHLLISGLTEEVWHVFHRAGLVKQIGPDNLYFTDESNPQFSTWKAALRAQSLC